MLILIWIQSFYSKARSEKWLDKEFWGKEDDLASFII